MWRLSLIMDRTLHRRRLVSLVSFLTIISIVSIMVTDLRFYIDKATERTLTVLDYVGPAEINNYGENHNLRLNPERHKNASDDDLKYILFWNEAYGSKEYDLGFGRQPFYDNLCPETRCYATDDRNLKPVDQFDAIFFHQRSLDFNDVPSKRNPSQRYVHYIMESAQYLYQDISTMNNFFNWTMTYRRDSDFYRPYGRIVKVKEHPEGEELKEFIRKFGRDNKHLAQGKQKQAAWFVSHCATQARREKYVKQMKKSIDVDVYGKCGKLKCSRDNETGCYQNMEQNYKFYLSFENSVCDDYVTEKFFNILDYNVIPVTYSGANFSAIAPPQSYINTLDFASVSKLSKYLLDVAADDELYASYFWWKEFYEKYYGANKCLYTLERFDTNGFNPSVHNKFVAEREKQAQRRKDKTGNLFEFFIQGSRFHVTILEKGGIVIEVVLLPSGGGSGDETKENV